MLDRDVLKYAEGLLKNDPIYNRFKVGDIVRWVNDYGVAWESKIIGFSNPDEWGNYIHLVTGNGVGCAYWSPHRVERFIEVKRGGCCNIQAKPPRPYKGSR